MTALSSEQASEELGWNQLDDVLRAYGKSNSAHISQYRLPDSAFAQTVLAKSLGEWFCREKGGWLYISHWGGLDDPYTNLELFYGYRLGRGESRELMEAPVHFCSPTQCDQFISIVSMVLYFGWDANIFDRELTYLVEISNDQVIDIVTPSSPIQNGLRAIFSRYKMLVLNPADGLS